jgi:bacterioferritin (cytochrome b1)
MQKLSDIVISDGISTNNRNSAILKTKFDLGEICFKKILQYLEKKDKNIAKVYEKTYKIHSEIINDFERVYTSLSDKYYEQKDENANLQKQVKELKTSLQKANLEKAAVLDIGESMEKQMQSRFKEEAETNNKYKSQIEELKSRLEETERENSELFERLLKNAKNNADQILSISPYKGGSDKKEMNHEQISDSKSIQAEAAMKSETFKMFNIGSAKRHEQVGQTNIRIMTLKQLKDIINEIYENKEKHDEK